MNATSAPLVEKSLLQETLSRVSPASAPSFAVSPPPVQLASAPAPASPLDRQSVAEWNFTWAAALIDALVAAGASNIVMSPGAQAAPLMMAARSNPQARVHVVIDERSAGFYALGLARASGRPSVVICTSGSAVGQLYPAVMEASASLVPLIVLASDRAPERQDSCAAQTIDQTAPYGNHARAAHHLNAPDASIDALPSRAARMVEQSLYPEPGPVYVNQPFREPLYARKLTRQAMRPVPRASRPRLAPPETDIREIAARLAGRPGVILAGARPYGAEFAKSVTDVALALRCPIIADPLSGLRFGAESWAPIITHGENLSDCAALADGLRPQWVLNFGGPMVSQKLQSWIKACTPADVILIEAGCRWPDPLRIATEVVRADPDLFCKALYAHLGEAAAPVGWLDAFLEFDEAAERILRAASQDDLLWEAPIIAALIAAAGEKETLFSGNSMSIRDFDAFSGLHAKPLRLLANRGTNGIDGSIASILGVATASGPTLAMIGDVAFAHDVGSLQVANNLDALIVVLNNGGGAIFDYQDAVTAPGYRDFLCPPSIDIAQAARACGWQHWRADSRAGFEDALREARSGHGARLIEAVIDRSASVARHRAYWAEVSRLGNGGKCIETPKTANRPLEL